MQFLGKTEKGEQENQGLKSIYKGYITNFTGP